MNCINQVIIEGKVFSKGKIEETKTGAKRLEICIETSRTLEKEDGSIQLLTEHFNIELWGKMAEVFDAKLKAGKGIRVVGRLKQGLDGKVSIVAEHLEIKYTPKEGQNEEETL